jgi:hypothetical protein
MSDHKRGFFSWEGDLPLYRDGWLGDRPVYRRWRGNPSLGDSIATTPPGYDDDALDALEVARMGLPEGTRLVRTADGQTIAVTGEPFEDELPEDADFKEIAERFGCEVKELVPPRGRPSPAVAARRQAVAAEIVRQLKQGVSVGAVADVLDRRERVIRRLVDAAPRVVPMSLRETLGLAPRRHWRKAESK